MMPKEFIQNTLLDCVTYLIEGKRHFMAFAVMANSIEFLGKCLDPKNGWDSSGHAGSDFNKAIDELDAFKNYRGNDLCENLRNGFAHFVAPKSPITLSNGNLSNDNGRTNLNCEEFYKNFKEACEEIIRKEFKDENDKMNKPFLLINPSQNIDFPNHPTSAFIG